MNKVDLKKLSKVSSSERAFLSVYISNKSKIEDVLESLNTKKKMLQKGTDDYDYLNENIKIVTNDLTKEPPTGKNIVIFCCWPLNYYEKIDIGIPVRDMIKIDSSPYILPLAQLQDEYENYLVIATTNEKTKMYIVSSLKTVREEEIKGNIKNHVKVGGWSQQRYERRRDKEFSVYVKDIIERIRDIIQDIEIRRFILVGSKETIRELRELLPEDLQKNIVGEKPFDLKKSEKKINEEIFKLLWEEERKTEKELWGKIKSRYLKGELAVAGIYDVLYFAKRGRIDQAIVNRESTLKGIRCRDCEELSAGETDICPKCGSKSVFTIDMINEITELLALTNGKFEFADKIDELENVGDIAATLRY